MHTLVRRPIGDLFSIVMGVRMEFHDLKIFDTATIVYPGTLEGPHNGRCQLAKEFEVAKASSTPFANNLKFTHAALDQNQHLIVLLP